MNIHKYEIKNGKYCVIGDEKGVFNVYSIDDWNLPLITRYKSFLAHKEDLKYANAYLDQMFFGENNGTTLIDGALINSSIQLLIKCFTNGDGKGRKQLNYKKVYVTYAKTKGETDLERIYLQFYNARNKTIVHDENDYIDSIIGLTVNMETGEAEELSPLIIRRRYLYKQNKELLKKILDVALSYVDEQLEIMESSIIEMYKQGKYVGDMVVMKCDDIELSNCW